MVFLSPNRVGKPWVVLTVLLVSGLSACRENIQAPDADLPQSAITAGGYSTAFLLPLPLTATASRAEGISDNGIVVGSMDLPNGVHAALWHVGGPPLDLGTLPGDYRSVATAINNFAVIVGYSCPASGACRPFKWTPQNGMSAMSSGSFPGGVYPSSINDSMVVAGYAYREGGKTSAVVWSKSGTLKSLHPSGAVHSGAEDVNNSNFIVGYAIQADNRMLGYRWSATGAAQIIGPTDGRSYPMAINSSGDILGNYHSESLHEVYLWTAGLYFPVLQGGPGGYEGWDISDRGRVIVNGNGLLPRTWREGPLAELPGFGGAAHAEAVNTCGTIVGIAIRSDGVSRAVRWSRRTCDR